MDVDYPELPEELRQLIDKGEGLEVERKEILGEDVRNELSKLCASFANTQGGSIFIGVNKNGVIVGANIDQHAIDRLSNEAANCRPPVKVNYEFYLGLNKIV